MYVNFFKKSFNIKTILNTKVYTHMHTFNSPYPQILHPHIQPIFFEKRIPESSKKAKFKFAVCS